MKKHLNLLEKALIKLTCEKKGFETTYLFVENNVNLDIEQKTLMLSYINKLEVASKKKGVK